MQKRYKYTPLGILNYADPSYVTCPKCEGCAVVFKENKDKSIAFTTNIISCQHCGFHGDSKRSNAICRDSTIFDWHEDNLPLWLQAVCGENTLYAFNPKHLAIIEGYVSAKLRERITNEDGCPSNGSMISRLPAWIKSAKNREDILKAINKLWLMVEKCSSRDLI